MASEKVNIRHHAVIEFLTLEKINLKDIHERMLKVYGDEATRYSTVKRWAAQFKHGRKCLEDDPGQDDLPRP